AAVVAGLELSNEAFPFMAASVATIAGVAGRVFRISFSGELAYELAVPARHALAVWSAVLEAGKPYGIAPYGLDALNTLRIEKGHVTAAELNGNTSADDLGMQRMLKKHGDFIGRALSQRPGLTAPERLQLVGVRPLARAHRLRNGLQLVAPEARTTSLGYVTSSTPSVESDGWVGLVAVASGQLALGVRPARWLLLARPAHSGATAARWQAACGRAGAAVDLSSGLAAWRLAGPQVRDALARACRLDLDPQVFPAGSAAATVMAQVGVILAVLPSGLLLLTPTSTARHLRAWLASTAKPFGLVSEADVTVGVLSGDRAT